MVLVNPVGIHIDDVMAEMFGRSPAELAEMLFADQSHPIAQAMHAMDEFTGDVGRQVEIPIEMVLPVWKAISATAKLGWDPYLHNLKSRGRLAPHHRARRSWSRRAGRLVPPSTPRRTRPSPGRPPRGHRRRRPLAPLREARRAPRRSGAEVRQLVSVVTNPVIWTSFAEVTTAPRKA